jgi:hypothetical protein
MSTPEYPGSHVPDFLIVNNRYVCPSSCASRLQLLHLRRSLWVVRIFLFTFTKLPKLHKPLTGRVSLHEESPERRYVVDEDL